MKMVTDNKGSVLLCIKCGSSNIFRLAGDGLWCIECDAEWQEEVMK